jgi:hypothetical protein
MKKRRCNWGPDNTICTTCARAGTRCEVNFVARVRPKGAKKRQMQQLEERVRQMEAMLTNSGIDASALGSVNGTSSFGESTSAASILEESEEEEKPATTAQQHGGYGDTIAQRTPSTSAPASCNNTPAEHSDAAASGSMEQTSVDNANGMPDFDIIPDFSHPWDLGTAVHEHQHQHSWMDFSPNRSELPPPNEATLLLQEYLEDWNKATPLFEPRALCQLFQDCYSGREPEDSNSWLAVTAVLGLAHRLRGMSPLATPQDDAISEMYKDKLLRAFPNLLMQDPTLLSVQCVVALGVLFYLSADHNRTNFFLGAALDMLEPMCLTNNVVRTTLEDQWVYTFWITFNLDADIAMRQGRLAHRRVADMDLIPLPPAQGIGEIRSSAGDWSINYHRMRAELAIIQTKIAECLLSNSARQKPQQEVDAIATRLASELRVWKSNWIFQRSPASLRQELHRSDMILLTALEASYFQTLYAIKTHMALRERRTTAIFDPDTFLLMGRESVQPCLADARRFVHFFRVLPRGETACIYLVCYAMVATVSVLTGNACANPTDPMVAADMAAAKVMVEVCTKLSGRCRSADCRRARQVCQHLYQQAATVIGSVPR